MYTCQFCGKSSTPGNPAHRIIEYREIHHHFTRPTQVGKGTSSEIQVIRQIAAEHFCCQRCYDQFCTTIINLMLSNLVQGVTQIAPKTIEVPAYKPPVPEPTFGELYGIPKPSPLVSPPPPPKPSVVTTPEPSGTKSSRKRPTSDDLIRELESTPKKRKS